MNNKIILNLQLACKNLYGIPRQNKIKLWLKKIFFSSYIKKIELTIRIVEIQEIINLNWYYLGKNYPTNVLSFSFNPPKEVKSLLIGDIVICKKIIEHEAQQNNISPIEKHWAHIIIHGSLHLLGYDHFFDKDFRIMNDKEINILKTIGY